MSRSRKDTKDGKDSKNEVKDVSDLSNKDLKDVFTSLIEKLDCSVNGKLKKIQDKLDKEDESMKILKRELTDVQLTIEDQDLRITDLESLKTEQFDPQCKRTTELEEKVKELQAYILHQENRSRKYNLLFYSLLKIEHENTTEVILSSLEKDLQMSPDDIQSIIIQNSHRIPRNLQNKYKPRAPDALIVKFSRMEDRNKVLNQARITTLPKGMAVRTDLPSQLKKKRGELAHKAYLMRKNDHKRTRIIETKDDVILQFRAQDESVWKRCQ